VVIHGIHFEGYDVVSIFSTKEKAEQYIRDNKLMDDGCEYFDILEWIVDE